MTDRVLPLFDGRLYPEGLSAPDLESLQLFGVTRAVLCPHLPPSPPKAKPLVEALARFHAAELPRVRKSGLSAWTLVGVPPESLPRRGFLEVLETLPRYFGSQAVAVGPISLLEGGADEEEAFVEQARLARRLKLPLVVDAPQKKPALLRRMLLLLRANHGEPASVLVSRVPLRHVRPVLARGHFVALSLHPESVRAEAAAEWVGRQGSERLVLTSEAGRGASDLLALPRAERLMEREGLARSVRVRALEKNAVSFFGRGG